MAPVRASGSTVAAASGQQGQSTASAQPRAFAADRPDQKGRGHTHQDVHAGQGFAEDPLVRGETFREHWHQLAPIATSDVSPRANKYSARPPHAGPTSRKARPFILPQEFLSSLQTVPSPDDLVAVVNLLAQMTTLLQLELEAAEQMAKAVQDNDQCDQTTLCLDSRDPLDSLQEPVLPCLDVLLSENILFHVLATSRMPVSSDYLWLYDIPTTSGSVAD
jgi:hypothetical protein